MTQSGSASPVPSPSRGAYPYGGGQGSSANLADILERVLDKGIVIVGDIKINLLDIELLTIKLRLLVASVDKAKEIGIDWWEHDPALSSRASRSDGRRSLADENERLRAEVKELRRRVEEPPPELAASESPERPRREARRKDAARPAEPRRKRRKPVNVDAEDEDESGDENGDDDRG
ncbi:gas vesicle protein [Streptomyces sp. MB09-02B]|uniref:gas vesicle protein n=1 Tax=Streptomyces sp. MB09-02B TaxID=3028667 RepID=UPI0029A0F7DB|nr:gas vesicle protein [Streptomyces sp. MB09-02B]MDX3638869.1 gas vesicle protein [Streptomyces sp. MB09-02B]